MRLWRLQFRIGKEGPPCGYGRWCWHPDPHVSVGLFQLWGPWTLRVVLIHSLY